VNEFLSPELRGRINKIVTFDPLSNEHLWEIARHHIKVQQERCFVDLGLTLHVTDAAVNFILNQPDVEVSASILIRAQIPLPPFFLKKMAPLTFLISLTVCLFYKYVCK